MFPHYPRPKLLDAIPLDAHAVIEASAGTGKTFAIENIVVELLLRDKATLDQMLVLTFTERSRRAPPGIPQSSRKFASILVRLGLAATKCHSTSGKLMNQPGAYWTKLFCPLMRLRSARSMVFLATYLPSMPLTAASFLTASSSTVARSSRMHIRPPWHVVRPAARRAGAIAFIFVRTES